MPVDAKDGCGASKWVTYFGDDPAWCKPVTNSTGLPTGAQNIRNAGWELAYYSTPDCSGKPIGSLRPEDDKKCKTWPSKYSSVSLRPLWNTYYRNQGKV
jgi:hypothetical protein